MTACIISLGYIVRYYDELPSFTLFLHGHDDHWHQIYNIHYIVHHLDFSQTYRNINNYWVNDRNSSSNTYMRRLQLLWNELFQDELGPMPSQVSPSGSTTHVQTTLFIHLSLHSAAVSGQVLRTDAGPPRRHTDAIR
jgi:hypothetical protein